MLAGVRTISGEDGPGGLIQDQLIIKLKKVIIPIFYLLRALQRC